MLSYAEAVYYMLNGESGDSSGTSKPKQLKITDRWTDTITPPEDHPNRWWDRVQVNVPKSTATLRKNHEKVEPEGKYKGFSQVSVIIPMHTSETFTRNLKSYTFENYKTRDTNPYPEDEAGWMQVQAQPSVLHQFRNTITENGTYTPPFSYEKIMDPDGAYDGVKNAIINVPMWHTQQEIEQHRQYLEQIEAQIDYYENNPNACPHPVIPEEDPIIEEEWDTGSEDPNWPDMVAAFPDKQMCYGETSFRLLYYGNGDGTSAPVRHEYITPGGYIHTRYVGLAVKFYDNDEYVAIAWVIRDTDGTEGHKSTVGGSEHMDYAKVLYKDFNAEIIQDGVVRKLKITGKGYFQGWVMGGFYYWYGPPAQPEWNDAYWTDFSTSHNLPYYYVTTWKVKS